MFDGDTIEFITRKFYKTDVPSVLKELHEIEETFEKELQKQTVGLFQKRTLSIMKKNYAWSNYLTNPNNYTMFNNGTIHVNLTLPTKLDEHSTIVDKKLFIDQHRVLIRILQWLSPLFVAKFGTGDPFSAYSSQFAKGSQRIAVSRYIGLGTYDSETMPEGKILAIPKSQLPQHSWYHSFYETTAYTDLPNVGLDINFNKHYAHGIEFRIFDAVSFQELETILSYMPVLMDFSLSRPKFTDPRTNIFWNTLAKRCVLEGKETQLTVIDTIYLYFIFGINIPVERPMYVTDILTVLMNHLTEKYGDRFCCKHMLKNTQPIKQEKTASIHISVPQVIQVSKKNSWFSWMCR
jgi:hypothetical protein